MNKQKILIDSGTSYSKLFYIDTGKYEIIPSKQIREKVESLDIAAATGHNAKKLAQTTINELIALAKGCEDIFQSGRPATVVDCGSRDIKYIKSDGGNSFSIDWNTECGAFCGQIVELLVTHFQFDTRNIEPAQSPLPLTCAILGMTRMFDLICDNADPESAFAMFIKGLADNIFRFAGKPDKIYLSGGLCDNPLFIKSFDNTEVVPLGRFILIEGLKKSFFETI